MIARLLWLITAEASFCVTRGVQVSPDAFIGPEQPECPYRKRYLRAYLVESEALKQGISVARYRAMERASRNPKTKKRFTGCML